MATRHAKECALSWPLSRALGLSLLVPLSVDTDLLGTFTGEISRENTPRHVAIRKAREGMAATGLPLGLGNEGSFGPHSAISFLPCDHEILAFIDDEQEFIAVESLFTRETNYNQTSCSSLVGAESFLEKMGFPSHHLVVRPEGNSDPTSIRKGVHCQEELRQAITRAVGMSPVKCVRLETDMRAHANPTRMKAIRRLGAQMARRLRTSCPECRCPGFGIIGGEPGLPCSDCGDPTPLILREVFECPRCQCRKTYLPHRSEPLASPVHCPQCNP